MATLIAHVSIQLFGSDGELDGLEQQIGRGAYSRTVRIAPVSNDMNPIFSKIATLIEVIALVYKGGRRSHRIEDPIWTRRPANAASG